MNARPYSLGDGQGATYRRRGIDFVVKVGELAQGRRLAFAEYTTRAGEEPLDHTHATEDEMFYVLRGAITFRCGGQKFGLEEGGFVFLPRGIEHGYAIQGPGDVRLLVITSPMPTAEDEAGWGGFLAKVELEGVPRGVPPSLR